MKKTDRVLPHNLDAEKSVLGAILLHEDLLAIASDVLKPEDFFRAGHQILFRAMLDLAEKRVAVDYITLRELLTKADTLDAVGGPAYIIGLTDGVPRSTNVEHHSRIVREKAILRELIYAATTVLADAYAAERDATEALADAEGAIYGIGERATAGGLVDGARMAQEAFALLERLSTTGSLAGLSTGLQRLDTSMLGLHRKHLTVIAARPGNGKSALMLHLARHVGMRVQQPVAVFSLEMSREELILRMLATESQLDGHRLNSGHIARAEYDQLSISMNRIAGSQIFVDDTARRTVLQIRSLCRRLKSKVGGLSLILIDYLQLMTPISKREQSREQDVSMMAWGCKEMAKDLDVPVILLSQLNRGSEQRAGQRPQLSDLRESGAIEQHADDVLFVHPPATADGTCELIIAKQRNGPRASVTVGYDQSQFKFWTLAAHP